MIQSTEMIDVSVGVAMLDRDHREMSEVLLELHEGLLTGKERRRISPLLRRLAQFTLTHFALEEGMMAATKYPRMAQHIKEHQRMMEEMEALMAHCNRGDLTLNGHSVRYLTKSNLVHVQKEDLHYGLWLKGNGRH